ncbi:hypothetical protein E3N88_20915 [Mikania micrantha]|uniref:Uncharacterized protein n=1 Tax=Mikania micrantha TaxID=192012 RepID=A0A5N6NIG4_9ASTR|nr:hypothetical protein E3N88_20915 [Mikania micrantha]
MAVVTIWMNPPSQQHAAVQGTDSTAGGPILDLVILVQGDTHLVHIQIQTPGIYSITVLLIGHTGLHLHAPAPLCQVGLLHGLVQSPNWVAPTSHGPSNHHSTGTRQPYQQAHLTTSDPMDPTQAVEAFQAMILNQMDEQ